MAPGGSGLYMVASVFEVAGLAIGYGYLNDEE
jgi:hypothetical protein